MRRRTRRTAPARCAEASSSRPARICAAASRTNASISPVVSSAAAVTSRTPSRRPVNGCTIGAPAQVNRHERLGEVLGARDQHRSSRLDAGADAVRADELLRVGGAGDRADAIEGGAQGLHADASIEDACRAVGEDEAHRDVGDVVGHAVEHRRGGPQQAVLVVQLVDGEIRQTVGRDAVEQRAPPRRADLGSHRRVEPGAAEEPIAGSQPRAVSGLRHRPSPIARAAKPKPPGRPATEQ